VIGLHTPPAKIRSTRSLGRWFFTAQHVLSPVPKSLVFLRQKLVFARRFPNNSGSFVTFTAMRRASSSVSDLVRSLYPQRPWATFFSGESGWPVEQQRRSRLIARPGVFSSRRRDDSNRRTFKPLCYSRTHTSTESCLHYLEVIEFSAFEARWAVVVVAHLVIFRTIKAGEFAV
jgi:hypothetical protein